VKCLINFTFTGFFRFHIPLSEHSKMSEVGSYMQVDRYLRFEQTATEQNGILQYASCYTQTSGTKFQVDVGTTAHFCDPISLDRISIAMGSERLVLFGPGVGIDGSFSLGDTFQFFFNNKSFR
jgi:hypothetical protein